MKQQLRTCKQIFWLAFILFNLIWKKKKKREKKYFIKMQAQYQKRSAEIWNPSIVYPICQIDQHFRRWKGDASEGILQSGAMLYYNPPLPPPTPVANVAKTDNDSTRRSRIGLLGQTINHSSFSRPLFFRVEWKKAHIHESHFSSVQSLSGVWLFATPWIAAHQATMSITNSRSLLKPMAIESVMPSSHLILCCSLLILPPIPPSARAFPNEKTFLTRWPKYWSFSFSISTSNEQPRLIFRMDWLDLLAVQGTLKSLLHNHSSKASIFWCSAFFTVQLSHPYMTNRKTIALTRWTFVGRVMSLLFNMLSRLVITFLPRSKCILISWLQSYLASHKENSMDRGDWRATVHGVATSWNRLSNWTQRNLQLFRWP